MDRKKILLIFVAAWFSAALLTWFLYASTKAPRVEKTVAIQQPHTTCRPVHGCGRPT